MALQTNTRNYPMSDADLCMFTSNLCLMLTDDLIPLGLFGLTALQISALEALGNAFEVYPSDETYRGLAEIATRTKDEKAQQVKENIRDMSARMEMKYGVQSPEWNRLGILNMNNFSDKDLLFAGRRVHGVCTEYLTSLADFGLTQIILDDMEDVCQEFEAAINAQMNANSDRQLATKERVDKGNEIYSLVSRYCDMGKRYWFDKNPVKYNQYIIYTPGPGTLSAPENLAFDLATRTFSWSSVENAASYQLQISSDNVHWVEIFSGADTSTVYEPVEENLLRFRVRGHNAGGFGEFSTILEINYEFNLPSPDSISVSLSNPATHQVSVNWNEISGATFYRVYTSAVAIGAPSGAFTLVGEFSVAHETSVVTTNQRHYYYIVAGNSELLSPPSIETFIDVA